MYLFSFAGGSDSVGIRVADTSNSVLENCYDIPRCDRLDPFRTEDGTCNNLRQPLYGRVFTPVQRVLPNDYADGFNEPRVSSTGSALPSARRISQATASTQENLSTRFTSLMMSFGQFLDHEFAHVPIFNSGGK